MAIAVIVYKSGGVNEKVMANESRVAKMELCIETTNKTVIDKLDQLSVRLGTVEGKLEILIDKKSKK
jgi:hypothetical protein